jgi:ATP-dependent Lon protease
LTHIDPDNLPGTTSDLPMLRLLARGKRLRKSESHRQDLQDIDRAGGNEYPVLPTPDAVIFPNLVSPLFIGRERSVRAVEAAEVLEVPLLVVAQRDPQVTKPGISDLYSVGTSAEVGRVLRLPDGSTTVLVQGIERVRILDIIDTEPYLRVLGVPLYEDERHDMSNEALMRAVLSLFEKVVDLNPNLPEDAYVAAMNEQEPGGLADVVAHVLEVDLSKRQELL